MNSFTQQIQLAQNDQKSSLTNFQNKINHHKDNVSV